MYCSLKDTFNYTCTKYATGNTFNLNTQCVDFFTDVDIEQMDEQRFSKFYANKYEQLRQMFALKALLPDDLELVEETIKQTLNLNKFGFRINNLFDWLVVMIEILQLRNERASVPQLVLCANVNNIKKSLKDEISSKRMENLELAYILGNVLVKASPIKEKLVNEKAFEKLLKTKDIELIQARNVFFYQTFMTLRIMKL